LLNSSGSACGDIGCWGGIGLCRFGIHTRRRDWPVGGLLPAGIREANQQQQANLQDWTKQSHHLQPLRVSNHALVFRAWGQGPQVPYYKPA
jgi:hypothetical protein